MSVDLSLFEGRNEWKEGAHEEFILFGHLMFYVFNFVGV